MLLEPELSHVLGPLSGRGFAISAVNGFLCKGPMKAKLALAWLLLLLLLLEKTTI